MARIKPIRRRTTGELENAFEGKSPVWAQCTWCQEITKCAEVHHTQLLADGNEMTTDGYYCLTCFLKLPRPPGTQ